MEEYGQFCQNLLQDSYKMPIEFVNKMLTIYLGDGGCRIPMSK